MLDSTLVWWPTLPSEPRYYCTILLSYLSFNPSFPNIMMRAQIFILFRYFKVWKIPMKLKHWKHTKPCCCPREKYFWIRCIMWPVERTIPWLISTICWWTTRWSWSRRWTTGSTWWRRTSASTGTTVRPSSLSSPSWQLLVMDTLLQWPGLADCSAFSLPSLVFPSPCQ